MMALIAQIGAKMGEFFAWIGQHAGKVTVSTVVVVGGSTGYLISQYKSGAVVHHQGDTLVEQVDGNFRYQNYKTGRVYGKSYDIRNNPREFRDHIAEVGEVRFGEKYGCSYHFICMPDSAYQNKYFKHIGAHASGFNSVSVGVMLLRTDNEELNRKVFDQFQNQALPLIRDSMSYYYDGLQFIVSHWDVATNGKTDPGPEYIKMMDEAGLRYDNRGYPVAIELKK